MKKINSVEEYINGFPDETRELLNQVRKLILKNASEAEEKISYGMPGYFLNGPLVYFAGYKNHIGFYAAPSGHKKFKKRLAKYKQRKGSVQFPLNKPLPLTLIGEIIKYRLCENEMKKK